MLVAANTGNLAPLTLETNGHLKKSFTPLPGYYYCRPKAPQKGHLDNVPEEKNDLEGERYAQPVTHACNRGTWA